MLLKETNQHNTQLSIYTLHHCTYMFQSQFIFRVLVVNGYINSTIRAYVQDIMIHKCVNHIQHVMS